MSRKSESRHSIQGYRRETSAINACVCNLIIIRVRNPYECEQDEANLSHFTIR